jgi:hypothetical protein
MRPLTLLALARCHRFADYTAGSRVDGVQGYRDQPRAQQLARSETGSLTVLDTQNPTNITGLAPALLTSPQHPPPVCRLLAALPPLAVCHLLPCRWRIPCLVAGAFLAFAHGPAGADALPRCS